jgi:hypothetical protein
MGYINPGVNSLGALTGYRMYRFEYSFAVDGGAIGSINLRGVQGSPNRVPSGFVVLDSVIEVLTALDSGGSATAALTLNSAADVLAVTAFGSAPWSSTGRKAGVPVSAATSVKTTAARRPQLVVADAALTAGKFRLTLLGYQA